MVNKSTGGVGLSRIGQGDLAPGKVPSEGEVPGQGLKGLGDGKEEKDAKSSTGFQVEKGVLDLTAVNNSFVLMAEYIPTWLVMLLGKTEMKDLVFVYVEKEESSLCKSLDLVDRLVATPSLEEFMQWPWGALRKPKELVLS